MNSLSAKKGRLLISDPTIEDPNFKRTVILLTEHNDSETIGFIINQATKVKLNQILSDFPKFDTPVYIGGPVEKNTLHFIHRLGEKIDKSTALGNGVFWSGNFETLKELIEMKQIKKDDIRFFIGYAGWGSGQLEHELKEQSWFVTKNNAELVFSNNQKLWRDYIKKMDDDYAIWSNMIDDPDLN